MKLLDDLVTVAMSDVKDGSMSKAVSTLERDENRRKFLSKQGVTPEQTTLVHMKYEGNDYRRYHTVGQNNAGDGIVRESTIVADALFTRDKNLALMLPVADCIGAVLYDAENNVLGLAHLGRHNLEQNGGAGVVAYMKERFCTKPESLHAWLSPAAGKANYPLYDFDGQSMHEVASAQLLKAGVIRNNIKIDGRDTTADMTLFSHSEFLKGNQSTDGRQALIAMMC